MAVSFAYRIKGIAPTHDPAWTGGTEALHREFWRAVVKIALDVKDRSLARGLDRHGVPMAKLSPWTVAHRHSAMGPADPYAPPLTPAHGLSRTRSLLRGRAHKDHAEFYWSFDDHTGATWGRILHHHRTGAGKLPVRDVIGMSPADVAAVRRRAWQWWAARVHGIGSTADALPTPAAIPMTTPTPAAIPTAAVVPIAGTNTSKVYHVPTVVTYHTKAATGTDGMITAGWYQKRRVGGVSGPITGPKPPTPKPKPAPIVVPIPAKEPYFSGHPTVYDRAPKPAVRPRTPGKHEPPAPAPAGKKPPKPKGPTTDAVIAHMIAAGMDPYDDAAFIAAKKALAAAAKPKPKPKPKPKVFPADNPGALPALKALGGSTGAELVQGPSVPLVRKQGTNAGHLREEAHADAVYAALGVPVPESRLYDRGVGRPTKLAVFAPGKTLRDVMDSDPDAAAGAMAELRKHFVADALMGNWDVIGANYDNILIGDDGKVYRIDNGGSLRYRAQGGLKSASQWSGTVGELETMRKGYLNPSAVAVFGSVTDAEIKAQAKALVRKKARILAALPAELRDTMAERLAYIEAIANAKPPKPPKGVKGWKATPESAFKPEFTSRSEADNYGIPAWKGWADELKAREKESVKYYTGSGYDAINDHVRTGRRVAGGSDPMDKKIDTLDAALRRAGTPEALMVWRGIKDWRHLGIDDPRALPYGFEVSEASFASTSFVREVARNFAGYGDRAVLFRLHAPKGTRGGYANAVKDYSSHPSEKEFITPTGVRYRIVKVETAPDGIPMITAEIVE